MKFLLSKPNALARVLTNVSSFGAYFEPIIQLMFPKWRSDLIRTEVISTRRESESMTTLVLKPGKQFPRFEAGQFVELTVEKEGVWLSRIFTISSDPTLLIEKGVLEISFRHQHKGAVTDWLPNQDVKWLNLSKPMGQFIVPKSKKDLLLISAGSGITPFRSTILEWHANPKLRQGRTITLLHFYRDKLKIQMELETIANESPDWLAIKTFNTLDQGRIDRLKVLEHCSDVDARQVMICGPESMMRMTHTVLRELHVEEQNIMQEQFGVGGEQPDLSNHAPTLIKAIEDIKLGGKQWIEGLVTFVKSNLSTSLEPQSDKTLLALAEEQGLKPVSGCRIGVCHQCICKKKSGVVMNARTGKISDTGPEEVQLCVSVPVGDVQLEL